MSVGSGVGVVVCVDVCVCSGEELLCLRATDLEKTGSVNFATFESERLRDLETRLETRLETHLTCGV